MAALSKCQAKMDRVLHFIIARIDSIFYRMVFELQPWKISRWQSRLILAAIGFYFCHSLYFFYYGHATKTVIYFMLALMPFVIWLSHRCQKTRKLRIDDSGIRYGSSPRHEKSISWDEVGEIKIGETSICIYYKQRDEPRLIHFASADYDKTAWSEIRSMLQQRCN